VIQSYSKNIEECTYQHLHRNPQNREIIHVGWNRPPEGWIKLNSDGTCKGNNDVSGCGGLFRNSDGRWIKGYMKKIGSCDALHAEMWGVYLGLEMAWRDRIPQLIVESDSKLLIDMITYNCNLGGIVPILVKHIHNLLSMDWQVQVLHTLREGNRSADWLANNSLSLDSYRCSMVESPPNDLHSLLFDDFFGVYMPKSVRIVF